MPAPRNRLYVGNIPFNATEADVKQFFDGFKVSQVKIILDHETQRSRGFCFVDVDSPAEQKAAIEKLNGQFMDNRRIVVSEAKEKKRDDGARDKSW